LEYTPPAGKAGEALDSITRTTQREVHEDLENFRRVVSGQAGVHPRDLEPEAAYHGDLEQIFGSLANVAVWGVVGGTIAHYVMDRIVEPHPLRNASSILTAPKAYVVGKRLGITRTPLPFTTGQSPQSKVAGYIFGIATGASILASATLRLTNRKQDALFVGQWAPTFLGLGALARFIGDSGIKTPALGQKASWAFSTAALGAIFTSLFWHAKGYRRQGLFVGQWAPTLMVAAALARIYRPG
ncbi:MAG: hypothetical protein IVW57_08385, partial [Ktedonobacterales bacterium]|nr:hypothetical protein [Ktedonobacterales bacterium]